MPWVSNALHAGCVRSPGAPRTKILGSLQRIFGLVVRRIQFVLIRGIRGGFNRHEFHENDHGHLDVIGLKHNFSQSLRPRGLTLTFNCTRG